MARPFKLKSGPRPATLMLSEQTFENITYVQQRMRKHKGERYVSRSGVIRAACGLMRYYLAKSFDAASEARLLDELLATEKASK